MHDRSGTNQELLEEISVLKQRIQELEKSEAELIRISDALRESEEQLRVLSENLAEGMVYQINSGRDGQKRMFTYLSPAIERLHGLKAEAVKRNPSLIYDQVDGKHRVVIAEAEAHAYATGSKLDVDLPMRLPSGDLRWRRFISSPHTDSDGNIIWDGIELDITEHQQTAQERNRLAAVIENAPDFIGFADATTRHIRYINQAGRRMCGIEEHEDINALKIADVHPEWTTRLLEQEIIPTTIQEGVWQGECAFVDRNGLEIPVSMVLMAHRSDTGNVEYFSTISRDITSRKREMKEMDILAKIGRVLNSSLNIEEVYEQFCIETRKLIPFDRLVLNLITQPQADTITISYVFGFDIPGRRAGDSFPFKGSLIEEIMKTKTSLFLQPEDEGEIVRRFPILRPIVEAGSRSLMVIPLISQDEVMGALHFQSKEKVAYTPEDLSLAEKTVAQIAGAIANAQMFNNLSKTERELQESDERLSILFNNDLTSIYIFELETLRLLHVNNTFVRLYGYSREEVLGGMTLLDISAEPEESAGAVRKTFDMGTVFIPLRWHRRKDGTVFPIEIVGGSYVWRGRRVMYGIAKDITERKRAEHETATLINIERLVGSTLEISEVYDQFAAEAKKLIHFDNLTINLYNFQENTMFAAFMYGLDINGREQGDPLPIDGSLSEAVIRMRASLLVQPASTDDIIRKFPRLSAIVKAGIRSIICIPLIYREEVIGVMHFRSKKRNAFTEQDHRLAERIGTQIAGAIANAKLYSELRKTEQSLRESEKRFRSLVESAAAGIAEVEAGTGRFLAVNPMLCKMVGRTEEEMLATTFMAITHPEDQKLHPVLSKRMYGGELDHYSLEKRYLRKDGEIVWVNITISRLWKPGDIPGRSITIVHDITERKQLEEALRETLDQLESRVRERTIELEETNTALRVLIKKGDEDQKRLEENLQSNINQLVTPFLSRLRVSQSNNERLTYLNILEANLDNIVSPFINRLSTAYKSLTPKEIQIAEMVKQGKRSKEIAELFGLSIGTVITHRNNIRKKFDLKSRNANLRSHLLSLV